MTWEAGLKDDISGEEGAHRQHFALNGRYYVIDLTPENAAKLAEALGPFIAKAKAGESHRYRSNPQAPQIREWARNKGIRISERGKIPYRIYELYYKEVGSAERPQS